MNADWNWGWIVGLAVGGVGGVWGAGGPELLDDRFEMPVGFHIYRAADGEVTGGSYDLVFDGEGRLLVGDGNAVRRLKDADGDGVYDGFEVVATELGGRGPQGLMVWGDRLFAVGGDGLQLFDGYESGRLVRRGRLGEKFSTGGDHDLHTVLRGYDGSIYLMAGNGAGVEERKHITEASSPMRREREASVFRLDPDGERWECVASGGRNPPSLGMHFTGELFSFDSDMEWHVGLPFYKPVRLNHWAVGLDQGWQDVGAYPSYFIDCVPHVLAVGRGSPNWGVFYEHTGLPARYRHAFVVCDYRWKRESDDQYATAGRLVGFFLGRDGAGWKAEMETLVRPKPGARDAAGRPVNFALVDVEVAPDGSLIVSDHNQGVWRIFYDARAVAPIPPVMPGPAAIPGDRAAMLRELLTHPQPLAEWSRVRMGKLRAAYGSSLAADMEARSLNAEAPLEERMRAVQWLVSAGGAPEPGWWDRLALDAEPEIRGQAAWLLGVRDPMPDERLLLRLLEDPDPMVRRRAAEAMTRVRSSTVVPALIDHLDDASRLTRSLAMNALAHHPASEWLETALAQQSPQTVMRVLVAARTSGQAVPPRLLHPAIERLLDTVADGSLEDRLDLMRVLTLFEEQAAADTRATVARFLLTGFPSNDRDVRWEEVRLLGLFRVGEAFGKLLALLRSEKDEVTQFHIAQSLARLERGFTAQDEDEALAWFESTQRGWFAEFAGKGVEFPHFWASTVSDFCAHHREAVVRHSPRIEVTSILGGALVDLLAAQDRTGSPLMRLYDDQQTDEARARVAVAFARVPGTGVAGFLRRAIPQATVPALRAALWQSLSAQPVEPENVRGLVEAIELAPPDVARTCAAALMKYNPKPEAALARACLDHVAAGDRASHTCEKLLGLMSNRQRPGFNPAARSDRHIEEPARMAATAFWSGWFVESFGHPFVAKAGSVAARSDEEVRLFVLGEASRGGRPAQGALVYEALGCHACHGGGAAPGREGRLFGPDLAGATRRLTRAELAEALAYPSKVVVDRFKAHQLEKTDGTVLTGFVTESTGEWVAFADAVQVHRIPRSEIKRLAPQDISLMPEHLLNPLSPEQIRDLLAFLDTIGVPAAGGEKTGQ